VVTVTVQMEHTVFKLVHLDNASGITQNQLMVTTN